MSNVRRLMRMPRTLASTVALVLCVGSASAAEFVVAGELVPIAQRLQGALPGLAIDGVAEVRRTNPAGWEFKVHARVEKTWVDELRVEVAPLGKYEQRVRVVVVRIEGGTLFSSEAEQADASAEWEAKVKKLLAVSP